MDESDMTIANSQTLSKKQAVNGNNTNTATKSIMRPSRKTTDEHHKSRAKMLAVANSASKNGEYTFKFGIIWESLGFLNVYIVKLLLSKTTYEHHNVGCV